MLSTLFTFHGCIRERKLIVFKFILIFRSHLLYIVRTIVLTMCAVNKREVLWPTNSIWYGGYDLLSCSYVLAEFAAVSLCCVVCSAVLYCKLCVCILFAYSSELVFARTLLQSLCLALLLSKSWCKFIQFICGMIKTNLFWKESGVWIGLFAQVDLDDFWRKNLVNFNSLLFSASFVQWLIQRDGRIERIYWNIELSL